VGRLHLNDNLSTHKLTPTRGLPLVQHHQAPARLYHSLGTCNSCTYCLHKKKSCTMNQIPLVSTGQSICHQNKCRNKSIRLIGDYCLQRMELPSNRQISHFMSNPETIADSCHICHGKEPIIQLENEQAFCSTCESWKNNVWRMSAPRLTQD
jgi:hypothetical protein